MKTYQAIAQTIDALKRCQANNNKAGASRNEARLESLMENAPSGSGFDNGTKVDLDKSTGERIVFSTSFHHMNEHGFYDGWTEHEIKIVPSFVFGFDLKVTGRNRRGIKDMIEETFCCWLSEENSK